MHSYGFCLQHIRGNWYYFGSSDSKELMLAIQRSMHLDSFVLPVSRHADMWSCITSMDQKFHHRGDCGTNLPRFNTDHCIKRKHHPKVWHAPVYVLVRISGPDLRKVSVTLVKRYVNHILFLLNRSSKGCRLRVTVDPFLFYLFFRVVLSFWLRTRWKTSWRKMKLDQPQGSHVFILNLGKNLLFSSCLKSVALSVGLPNMWHTGMNQEHIWMGCLVSKNRIVLLHLDFQF